MCLPRWPGALQLRLQQLQYAIAELEFSGFAESALFAVPKTKVSAASKALAAQLPEHDAHNVAAVGKRRSSSSSRRWRGYSRTPSVAAWSVPFSVSFQPSETACPPTYNARKRSIELVKWHSCNLSFYLIYLDSAIS